LPTIQNEIITARINKGLTQRELGERLGYQSKSAQVTVARWEAGFFVCAFIRNNEDMRINFFQKVCKKVLTYAIVPEPRVLG